MLNFPYLQVPLPGTLETDLAWVVVTIFMVAVDGLLIFFLLSPQV
jgi:hypothetical protein